MEKAERLYIPNPRECALLALHLVNEKEKALEKEITRLRVAEVTLKRLWMRPRLTPQFVQEVADWLYPAGIALFFAGSTYALVKISAVKNWPRITSKRLSADLQEVRKGTFNFTKLEPLLLAVGIDDGEDEGPER